jgi:cytochrome c oxidase subunit 4
MSAPAHAVPASEHALEENKFQLYVQVAMLLAVITGIEIITVYLPFSHALLFWTLAIFSAIKFLFVIFIFMHLRWDRPFCTILFFIGLILAGGTMWALLQLFSVSNSFPLTSSGG